MALQIDAMVQKAITLVTNVATMIPAIWAAELEPNLRKRAVLQQSLIENTDLLNGPGDRVHIPILPDLAAAAALTEGTDMVVGALTTSQEVVLTPAEVGKAIGISRKALDRLGYDGMAAIVDRLGYSMSQYLESTIAALWNASVPTLGGSMTVQYPNGHASGTIVSTDTMSDAVIRHGVATLQSTNVLPFDDGNYLLFMSPLQYEQFIEDTNVRTDLRYGNTAPLFRGEVGVFANCRIILSNYIVSPTENTIPAYKSLLVGPRWAAVAWKRRPELVVDPTLYDFGRRRQVAVSADLDIELLHNDRGLVITTAA